jgi:hypothetical protein
VLFKQREGVAAALPYLARMALHPQLPQSRPAQEIIAETLHRQPRGDPASAPVAEQLVGIQEKLDALELRVPGRWNEESRRSGRRASW